MEALAARRMRDWMMVRLRLTQMTLARVYNVIECGQLPHLPINYSKIE